MTNIEKVEAYLISILPGGATNSEIREATGVKPHQQVFQITQKLMTSGKIEGRRMDGEWHFFARSKKAPPAGKPKPEIEAQAGKLNANQFESFARRVLGRHYGVPLEPRSLPGVPKTFDFVSSDGAIVGDAKYYTLVRGTSLPPAKFATIAEHVWLLEKTSAREKFLVFGNDRRVPEMWLKKHRHLCPELKFYFLSEAGALDVL